ncbi:MAG: ABC transporter permease subunit, partial [Prevotella sp.]
SSVIAFPLFYQTVRSALQSVDHNMEDVARTLGASELRIFFTIAPIHKTTKRHYHIFCSLTY